MHNAYRYAETVRSSTATPLALGCIGTDFTRGTLVFGLTSPARKAPTCASHQSSRIPNERDLMRHRPHRGAGRPPRNANGAGAALMLACLILASPGCAPAVMEGRAASMLYDPDRVGGLHATHGLSGVRPDAPGPQGDVEGTDGGDDDRLALLAVNDIQGFGTAIYPQFFAGDYPPVSAIRSYDSTNPLSGRVCGRTVIYGDPNASYCRRDDSISWARGSLIPNARKYFGDAAVAGVPPHETGPAVKTRGPNVDHFPPPL